MKKYRFQIRKQTGDKQFKTETVEINLTEDEYNSIRSDSSDYKNGSALVSSKLKEKVKTLGFPIEIKTTDNNKPENKVTKSNDKKTSLWKPIWALPFKLTWRIIKMIWKLIVGK